MAHDFHLPPLSISDLVRNVVVLYRRAMRLVTLIVLIPLLPLTIVHLFILTAPATQQLVSFFQDSVLVVLVDAVLIAAASSVYTNQSATVGSAYRRVGQRFGVLFVALTLQGVLVLIGGGLVWSILQQSTGTFSDIIRTGVSVLLVGIPLLFCIVRLYLVPAIVVLEQYGPGTTLRQSWWLTKHGFWRTVLVLFMSGLVGVAVSALLTTIMSTLFSNRTSTLAQWSYAISTTILMQLTLLIVWPIQSILTTVLYHDLKVRAMQTPQMDALVSNTKR